MPFRRELMMTCEILLISGSLRARSVNSAIIRAAAQGAPLRVAPRVYPSMGDLPLFNPDDDSEPLDRSVADLRKSIGRADALFICTPEYAGGLPGSFKNLLDWTVGSSEMTNKLVGWVNAASPAAPAGGEDAYASLRKVLSYVDARIVEAACVKIPMSRQSVDADGLIIAPSILERVARALICLADAATARREG